MCFTCICLHMHALLINETLLFYGDSYATFPPVLAAEFFDLRFYFRTVFPDALIVYSGNASQV